MDVVILPTRVPLDAFQVSGPIDYLGLLLKRGENQASIWEDVELEQSKGDKHSVGRGVACIKIQIVDDSEQANTAA